MKRVLRKDGNADNYLHDITLHLKNHFIRICLKAVITPHAAEILHVPNDGIGPQVRLIENDEYVVENPHPQAYLEEPEHEVVRKQLLLYRRRERGAAHAAI